MKQGVKTAALLLVLLLFTGCAGWNILGPQGGTVVEMPRPQESDVVAEQPGTEEISVDKDNVEKIVEGLVLPDHFIWTGVATYFSEKTKKEFSSSISVDKNHFYVEVKENNRLATSVLNDGTYTYTLQPSGKVVQKIATSERFTYQMIAMAASIGTVLPTDRENRKNAVFSQYNGKNCLYVEVQNNKILEKYYLDVEWGYPLRVECFLGADMVYSFETSGFSEEQPSEELFEVEK